MLGYMVKDKVSGITGVAVSRATYLNGCVQYSIQPQVKKDDKLPDQVKIDEQQLVKMLRISNPTPSKAEKSFKMLEQIKDPVTGTKGKVTAVCVYLDGTVRYGYQPKIKRNATETQMFWQDSEVLVSEKKPPTKKKVKKPPGGPQHFSAPSKVT